MVMVKIGIGQIIAAFLLLLSGAYLAADMEHQVVAAIDLTVGLWLLWTSIQKIPPAGV